MKRVDLSIPQFGFVIATRGALGVGLGLLLSRKLSEKQRQKIGLGLLLFGALTTIPAIMTVRGSFHRHSLWAA